MSAPVYRFALPPADTAAPTDPFALADVPARFEDFAWWTEVALRGLGDQPPRPAPDRRERIAAVLTTTRDRLRLAWDVLRGHHACLEEDDPC